jgi:predicted ATPase
VRAIDTDPKPPRVRAAEQLTTLLISRKTEEKLARASGDTMRAKVHEAWILRVQSALRRLLHQRELTIVDDRDGLHLDLPDGRRMHLDELSRGHASAVMSWAEIMMRVEAARLRNDHMGLHPAGVVVIDAPETDLDVRLQRDLLPGLAEIYPRITLIVATHSPLVAVSLDDAVVYDLARREARRGEDVRTDGLDALLRQMFGREDFPRSLMSLPPPKPISAPPPPAPNSAELSADDTLTNPRPPKRAVPPPSAPPSVATKRERKRPRKHTLTGSGPWAPEED